jgi:carbamoyltransferase
MVVLGIHDGHDASACLMRDGQVVLGSAEERRRNVKNYAGAPTQSIEEIFKRSGVKPAEVDLVTMACRIRTVAPSRNQTALFTRVMKAGINVARYRWATRWGQAILAKRTNRAPLFEWLQQFGVNAPSIAVDHHSTHAASAYHHRPWDDDAVILTMDGAGDGLCATVSRGHGHDMEVLASTPKFHSVAAHLYSAITMHLGMRASEHEYKVMGMAPYGQAEYCISHLRGLFEVRGLEFFNKSGKTYDRMGEMLHRRLKQQRFDNISAACQIVFEELVVQWAKNAVAATGLRKVCCAGGAFLNVKANKLIRELPEVDQLYVYPASDDGGTSEGAAILGYLHLCKEKGLAPKLDLPKDMYLGLGHTDEECKAAIDKTDGIDHVRLTDVPEQVGELLARRQIIARFSGREEWGPRALGNRTIMADPRDMGIIRKLNFAIKLRDFWMPFAASILEEDAEKYIDRLTPHSNFMIQAFDTKQPAGEEIVAGTHPFDKTVRPQVVNELNPGYRDIIRAFKRRTGIGAMLNTSFNLHGFPICGTPEVAIDTLKRSALDGLLLESYLVWRKGSPPPGF